MEFMVHITVNYPLDGDRETLAELKAAESKRAAELAAEGVIKKIWRKTGQKANVGIWHAADATHLHTAIARLPLFPWLEVEVWLLSDHPNDPKKYGALK